MNRFRTFAWTFSLLASALAGMFALHSGPSFAEEDEEEAVETEVAVRVGRIVRATLHGYVVAYGAVELEPPSRGKPPTAARIGAPVSGIVSVLDCGEGQRVSKGDVLFRLDSRLADLAVEKAEKAVEFAEQNLARQKRLERVEGTSKRLLEEAEQQLNVARSELATAKAEREFLNVRAPFSGTIMHVNAVPGDVVDETSILAEMMDLDRLVVAAEVPSKEFPLLKIGQPVEFISRLSPAAAAMCTDAASTRTTGTKTPTLGASGRSTGTSVVRTGRLVFLGPRVDPKTDTVKVRASTAPGGGLKLGQFVKVRIRYEERKDRLAVPEESVVTDVDGRSVIAVVEADKAVKVPVKTGLEEDGLVEVEGEGLKEGMTVVTQGAYGLPGETRIRVIGK